jgi:hypothetical protein
MAGPTPFFDRKTEGHLALRGSVLSQCAAGLAIGYAKGLPHMVNAPATAGGAQKFPRAALVRIILTSSGPTRHA